MLRSECSYPVPTSAVTGSAMKFARPLVSLYLLVALAAPATPALADPHLPQGHSDAQRAHRQARRADAVSAVGGLPRRQLIRIRRTPAIRSHIRYDLELRKPRRDERGALGRPRREPDARARLGPCSPIAADDSYNAVANTQLAVGTTPGGPAVSLAPAQGVLANDTIANVSGGTDAFVLTPFSGATAHGGLASR